MSIEDRTGGFTLLEVLAAVAIMALVFTQLAAGGMQGLALEGDADRRLRASLIADRLLADIEARILQDEVPTPGHSESEEDEFFVTVDVGAFDVALPLQPEPPPGRRDTRRRADRSRDPVPSLFSDGRPAPGTPSPIRSVEIRVAWEEAGDLRRVQRAIYVLDPAVVTELLTAAGIGETEDQAPIPEGLGAPEAP